jgi:Tol biopolymer transport system component
VDLLGAARDLYLLSADLQHLRPLIRDAHNVSGAAWSSDSRWLAISFEPPDRPEGLYLVEVGTGRLRLVMPGDFGTPAWLPGDERLVVPVGASLDPGPGDVGLYVVSLPPAWRSSS